MNIRRKSGRPFTRLGDELWTCQYLTTQNIQDDLNSNLAGLLSQKFWTAADATARLPFFSGRGLHVSGNNVSSNVITKDRFMITGDYRFLFTFDAVSAPTSNMWQFALMCKPTSTANHWYFTRDYFSGAGHRLNFWRYVSSWYNVGYVTAPTPPTIIRMDRVGNTITMYYWGSGAWQTIGSYNWGSAPDFYLQLLMYSSSSGITGELVLYDFALEVFNVIPAYPLVGSVYAGL